MAARAAVDASVVQNGVVSRLLAKHFGDAPLYSDQIQSIKT